MVRTALRLRSAPIVWAFHDVPDPAWFQRCIDEISSVRDIIPLGEVARNPRRPETCAVTFDDGLRSVLSVADPILRERGLPYTVFVSTEVLSGGPVPWFLRLTHLVDRLGLVPVTQKWKLGLRRFHTRQELISALKQVPLDAILERVRDLEEQHAISPPDPLGLFLSGGEIRGLSTGGVTIGSHTHRHPILSLLSARDQRREVEQSVRLIESLTGRRPIEFAYPNGTPLDYDATTIAILRGSGIRLAVTTTQRHLGPANNLLALPRIGLTNGDSSLRRAFKSVAPSLSLSQLQERRLRSRVAIS